MRKKILYFDMEKIAIDREILVESEQEVKKRATYEIEHDLVIRLDLEEALKTLTDKQRQCFELFSQGYTFREIASKFSISLPAVQKHINLSKKKLKYFLGDGIQNP